MTSKINQKFRQVLYIKIAYMYSYTLSNIFTDQNRITIYQRMNFEEMKISQYSQFFLLYDK